MIKLLKTADVRKALDSYYRNEISYSRMIEMLNECVNKALDKRYLLSVILYGVYRKSTASEGNLISVHNTEEGAEKNKANLEKETSNSEIYYVDYVVLHK